MDFGVNYLVVLVAAIVNMALGSLWYSPRLFGAQWLHAMGWSAEEMDRRKKKAKSAYMASMVASLVMAYVLALFIKNLDARTAQEGAIIGFWLWLGFVVTTALASVAFEGRSKTVYYINSGYNLVALVIMGALLAGWR